MYKSSNVVFLEVLVKKWRNDCPSATSSWHLWIIVHVLDGRQ